MHIVTHLDTSYISNIITYYISISTNHQHTYPSYRGSLLTSAWLVAETTHSSTITNLTKAQWTTFCTSTVLMYWQVTRIGCWSCRGFVNSYFLLTRHKLQRTFMICCQKLIVFLSNFQARIFWRNFPYFTTSPSLHDEFWMMLQLLQPAPIFSRSCLSKSSLLWSSRTQYS